MRQSYPFDPSLHDDDSPAARGVCSVHGSDDDTCAGEPVVSFEGEQGTWQSGCSLALEQLVERGEILPLGQGA